jgi:hypothetical protein
LIFEGAPIIEPPLVQAAREAVVHDGAILDTSLCTPLDEREQAELQKLIAEEEQRLLPERQAARSAWSLKHIERLIGRGIPESDARSQVDRWIDHSELTGAFELPFDKNDLVGTTVADVLADPDRFINETMADPLEGLPYGRGKAILFRRPDGSLFINSFAHGGMVYELKGADFGVSVGDFYAYMPMHSYIYAPSRDMWPASSVNARIPPITNGDKKISATLWLDQNKPVEQMTWAPGAPISIRDRLIAEGGWIERPGCTVFNLFRPSVIVPRGGDVERWLSLVRRVFPDQDERIVLWLAHRVQRPWEKINHALVLGGKPGIGKDTILEPIKQAIGPWNFADVTPKQVLGRFNGHLKSVIMRVSEARDLGEFDRFAFYDHMKAIIAAPPDVLRIDEKNLREYYVPNLCGVVITTNHKTDGIFLSAGDRRHLVAWSNLTQEDFDSDFWRKQYRWYASGGNEAIAEYLTSRDLSGFDPKAPPPKTAAFWEIVNANRAPEDAELADVLDALGKPHPDDHNKVIRPDVVTLDEVASKASALQPAFAEWLRDRKNARRIPHRFEDCHYVVVRNPHDSEGRWKIAGRRHTIYGKDSLTENERVAAAFAFTGSR